MKHLILITSILLSNLCYSQTKAYTAATITFGAATLVTCAILEHEKRQSLNYNQVATISNLPDLERYNRLQRNQRIVFISGISLCTITTLLAIKSKSNKYSFNLSPNSLYVTIKF